MSRILRGVAACLASLVALTATGPAHAQSGASTTVVVASFGGNLDKVYAEALKPFLDARNIVVKWVPGSSLENAAKVVATAGRPEYDLVLFDNLAYSLASSKGVLAKVDEAIVTNYKDLDRRAQIPRKDGLPVGFYVAGLMYNTQEFAKRGWAPPTGWADLFRPQFCNVLGLANVNYAPGVAMLVMLAGGDINKVPQAIEKMGTLKNCVQTLEEASPKLEEKTQMGVYLVGLAATTRVPALAKQNVPVKFVFPREGTLFGNGTISVVKGAPNEKLAQEISNYLIGPQAQLILMSRAFYVPTNTKVKLLPELLEYGLPSPEQMGRLITVSDEEVLERRRGWQRDLQRAMAR